MALSIIAATGIASLQANLYFLPGDMNINTDDTTVTALSEKLLNVDEIKKIIIAAQTESDSRQSQFFILGDCCSNQVSSKW